MEEQASTHLTAARLQAKKIMKDAQEALRNGDRVPGQSSHREEELDLFASEAKYHALEVQVIRKAVRSGKEDKWPQVEASEDDVTHDEWKEEKGA